MERGLGGSRRSWRRYWQPAPYVVPLLNFFYDAHQLPQRSKLRRQAGSLSYIERWAGLVTSKVTSDSQADGGVEWP
jgi:hypothetical protein